LQPHSSHIFTCQIAGIIGLCHMPGLFLR
jgi:hypothetical protein